jgi:hypothetical protein
VAHFFRPARQLKENSRNSHKKNHPAIGSKILIVTREVTAHIVVGATYNINFSYKYILPDNQSDIIHVANDVLIKQVTRNA